MLKLVGWVGVVLVAAWAGATSNHGCQRRDHVAHPSPVLAGA